MMTPTEVFRLRCTIHGSTMVIGSGITRIGHPRLQWKRHHEMPFPNHAVGPQADSWRGKTYPRQHSSSPRMLVTNNGIHAAKTDACQPGFWARNDGDGWKPGSRWRASASKAADAITITRSPTMVQMASPRFIGASLNLLRHSVSVGTGSSNHAITLPNI